MTFAGRRLGRRVNHVNLLLIVLQQQEQQIQLLFAFNAADNGDTLG